MFFFLFLIIFSSTSFGANRSYNEVLEEMIPKNCTQKKENIFLTQKERKMLEKISLTPFYGGLALRYVTTCPNSTIKSFHYVDSHIVRTLNETIILIIKNNEVDSFVVSSFNEPPEYIAPLKWYQQFKGVKGKKVLRVREEIDALSGATLTVNASISAVNKILALHHYLQNKVRK